MIERTLEIATRDGATTTFISHPERGGPHPLIVFLMDAPGIREELRDMCRRLASVGYYVMLPNLYYRQGAMEIGPIAFGAADPDEPSRRRMFELAGSVNIPGVMSDVEGLLAFAEGDPACGKGPAGAVGYCLSGRFAIMCPAAFPERFSAAASIYGTHWMTDKPTSPHLAIQKTAAEYYFACAEVDHWVPLEMVEALRTSLAASPVNAEVELYPGAEHGFAFWQRPAYNRDAAERHWERLFALFGRALHPLARGANLT